MLRVVLESSTTREFPDNENNHFKIRFPAPLQLENGTCEIDLHSITFPNRHDRDTSRLHNDDVTWPFQFTGCSRQLDDNQVLQWEGYILNQEARIATSGIYLMTILKHRIDSEQHLVNQNFASSSRGRQYYSFPSDNITAGWDRNEFILHCKSYNQIQACGLEFRIEKHFSVKMGWFEIKNNTYRPVE